MGCNSFKKKLTEVQSVREYTIEEALDLLTVYLNENSNISMKGYSALLSTELGVDKAKADKIIEYVLQPYNTYRYGYKYNSETEVIMKLTPLFAEKDDYALPTESEFNFAVERLADFAEYLKKNERSSFSVTSFRLYIAKMLKKKIAVESVVRYLANEELITFVDEKTIYYHIE